MEGAMNRVCVVVSAAVTIKAFLLEQIRTLALRYDVDVIVNTTEAEEVEGLGLGVRVIPMRIERNISPVRDVIVLSKLIKHFAKTKYSIVHSYTPKAGLLAMISSAIAHVPIRVHTFTGQVWATSRGIKRWVLKGCDRIIARMSTNILIDSNSQREFIIDEGVVTSSKSCVLANGSISGVDEERFFRDDDVRKLIRDEFGVGDGDSVIMYLGRLKRDKGVIDLARVFTNLCKKRDDLHLLIVGPDEENVSCEVKGICKACLEKINLIPYVESPEKMMSAADMFCLPSYREGFGTSIIEAACCGLPAVGSRIYGISDSVEDGKSGLLFEVGNHADLERQLLELINDKQKRIGMGLYARARAVREFSRDGLTQAVIGYYKTLLSDKGCVA